MRTERVCKMECGKVLVIDNPDPAQHQPAVKAAPKKGIMALFKSPLPKPTVFDMTGWSVVPNSDSQALCPECKGKVKP